MLDALLDDTFPWRRDTEGRPLAESAAPVERQAPTELVACPFAGHRRGEPMNRSAWGQVARGLDAALAELVDGAGPTAADAWMSASRLRWQGLSYAEPVPLEVAVAYKLAVGLQRPLTSWLLLNPGAADRPLAALVSPEHIVQRLEDEGWLHGAQQVCPAPPAKIERAWRALCEATRPPTRLRPALRVAEDAAALVVGAWAVLGATRQVLLEGRLHELPPTWRLGTPPPSDGPEVLHLLLRPGPTALVREVPRFDPAWALHVYRRDAAPPAVAQAVTDAHAAVAAPLPFAALDAAWDELRGALPLPAPS